MRLSILFIMAFVALVMTGCNADQEQTSTEQNGTYSYITGSGNLCLTEFQVAKFTQKEARQIINLTFPEYRSCIRGTDAYNTRYQESERCKCQVKYLPRKYWSRKALIYELGHITDLLNECSNIKSN